MPLFSNSREVLKASGEQQRAWGKSVVRTLKAVPPEITRATSFVAEGAPASVIAGMRNVLENARFPVKVDLQTSMKPKLIGKAISTSGGATCEFRIRLYRNSSDEVVVECMRNAGCTQLFNQLYRELLSGLADIVLRKFSASASTPRVLKSEPSFPQFLPQSCARPPPASSSSLSTMMSCLQQRAKSSRLDEQMQACDALMDISQGAEWDRALEQPCCADFLSMLEVLVSSADDEIVRAGATLLHRVLNSEGRGFREKASSQLLGRMLALLGGPVTYLTRETKQQLSAALFSIRSTRPQAFTQEQNRELDKQASFVSRSLVV